MWEAIATNRRRSRLLIGVMGAVLVLLGFMIGAVADPEVGGPIGAVVALVYWLVLLAIALRLLKRLNRDELQGVIAHEIGHIKNLDVRFMTLAAVMLASITIISDLFLRSLWFGAGRRRSSKIDPRAQLAVLAFTVLLAILAPFLARLLYLACSRQREYLADASAARFTRYPPGLASALEKIALGVRSAKGVNRAIAPLYIVNPLQGLKGSGMLSTHPPTEQRIKILRAMAGSAGWVDYENAFREVRGRDSSCIGKKTLGSEGSVPIREATAEGDSKREMVDRIKEVDGLLGRIASLILIPCLCGVEIRVPQNLERDTFKCPRCGREHPMPRAEGEAASAAPAEEAPRKLRYRRQGAGWESFKCACGKAVQLSPAFHARMLRCRGCHREIEIVPTTGVPAGTT
jgi:heat shock protein HtpX